MQSRLDKRRKEILTILAELPISSTQQLADMTKVSNETMRKDLDALAEEGMIIKVHGGVALAAGNPAAEIPFDLRTTKNPLQKKAIANKAVSLIQPDDTILLESCTTSLELAKALLLQPELLATLIVVTNSFSIASLFDSGKKCKRMFFLGGWVYPSQYSALSYTTAAMLKEFHLSKAFLSGAALSTQFILGGYQRDDVNFQKSALQAAQEIILMIDSSKFAKTAIFSVAELSSFHYLITDKVLTSEEAAYVDSTGIHYLHAPVLEK